MEEKTIIQNTLAEEEEDSVALLVFSDDDDERDDQSTVSEEPVEQEAAPESEAEKPPCDILVPHDTTYIDIDDIGVEKFIRKKSKYYFIKNK
jgi:hypothetical protein